MLFVRVSVCGIEDYIFQSPARQSLITYLSHYLLPHEYSQAQSPRHPCDSTTNRSPQGSLHCFLYPSASSNPRAQRTYRIVCSLPTKVNICALKLTHRPEKWISNWFGRQRGKSRKAVDKTTGTVATLKTEHQKVPLESDPPSSSPRSAAQELPEPAHKPIRRKAPRTKKPKAPNSKSAVKAEPKELPMPLMSAATVPLGQPLPSLSSVTCSIVRDQSQNITLLKHAPIMLPATTPQSTSKSVQPKYSSGRLPAVNFAEVFSSMDYSALGSNCRQISSAHIQQGPIMRSDFRHSFADDYSFDSDAASHPETSLDLEPQRPSSPTSSEAENSMTTTRSGATIALTSCNEPFTPAGMTRLWGNSRSDISFRFSSTSPANQFNPTSFNSAIR